MLNFSNLKLVKTANTRDNSHFLGTRTQNFSLKYKRFFGKNAKKEQIVNTSFTLSNAKFAELGMENFGMIQAVEEGKAYLIKVGNDDAVLLKRTSKNEKGTKGKVFKSTLLEKALAEYGVIDDTKLGSQKLDITLVEGSEDIEIGGVKVYGVYEISRSADQEQDETEKADDAAEAASHEAGTAEVVDEAASTTSEVATTEAPQGDAPAPVSAATTTTVDPDDF